MQRDLSNFMVLHIGGGKLASEVVKELEFRGARITSLADIPGDVALSANTLVVFGGEWFEKSLSDPRLLVFLRNAALSGAKLVMIGGATSKFFVALEMAGLDKITTETGVVRNPAYFDPPQVGFKMEREGDHSHPSILISNSSNVSSLVEALLGWL